MLTLITVTSLEDNLDADGEVTLREAVLAANTDQSIDGSAAGQGPDVIGFADGLEGTISLVNSLQVREDVVIYGHGKTKTILQGSGSGYAFDVDGAGEVAFAAFRIREFATAIHSSATDSIRLREMDITRNKQVGLVSRGETNVSITSSVFYKNGGGAYITGLSGANAVTINGSRFDANRAFGHGVGARIDGRSDIRGTTKVSIRHSTFSNNVARSSRTRAYSGAGVRLFQTDAHISRSTFSGNNTATDDVLEGNGADIGATNGSLKIEESTFSGSIGPNSVFVDRVALTAQNSIFASNGGQDFASSGGSVEFDHIAHSIVRTNTGTNLASAVVGSPDANGNMIGTDAVPIDPLLGDLANNGGTTKTHLPMVGSPVIDAGYSDERHPRDQRWFTRLAGEAIDIGAVEVVDVRFSFRAAASIEGDDGTANLAVTLSLSEAIDTPITLLYETIDLTATAGEDYESVSGSAQLAARRDRVTILIPILGDSEVEKDEEIGFRFSSSDERVVGMDSRPTATITDEDYGVRVIDGVLFLSGTQKADTVDVSQTGDDLEVNFNGQEFKFAASEIESIEFLGRDRDDSLVIEDSIQLPAYVVAGRGHDTIVTGGGNDTVYGGLNRDLVRAGGGHDWIDGDGGRDMLYGESGNDSIYGSGLTDLIEGGDGHDWLSGSGGRDVTVRGGNGNDRIVGGYRSELAGGKGNDLIFGGPVNDVILGGRGSDTILGEKGPDQIRGGGGNDWIYGLDGADSLWGDAGDDTVDGGNGKNFLALGDGDDYGLTRAGSVFGGAGNDTVRSISAGELRGGVGNDSLLAGAGQSVVYGSDGDDTVTANGGTVWGGAGNDLLRGGSRDNEMHGGSGADTINGGNGNDLLLGGGGADSLFGGGHNDSVSGGAGNDVVEGGEGDDTLLGENGNDLLLGWSGDDSLDGGLGRDFAIGGALNDVLATRDGEDLLVSGVVRMTNAELLTVLAEWSSLRTLEQRVANIRDGSGTTDRVNGDNFLVAGATVRGFQGNSDTLNSGSGPDWLFAYTSDTTDRANDDLFDAL